MNKKILIIFIVSIVFGILGLLMILFGSRTRNANPSPSSQNSADTSSPGSSQYSEPTQIPLPKLEVVATEPQNGQKDVPLNNTVAIVFNRPFSEDEIEVSFHPPVDYTQEYIGKRLILKAVGGFGAGTIYTYIVKYKYNPIPSFTFSFTTLGPQPKTLPDTQPIGAAAETQDYQRSVHPDVFLSNLTPYEQDEFYIENEFVDDGEGYFRFIIRSKQDYEYEEVEQALSDWLLGLGLSLDQIKGLKIVYR